MAINEELKQNLLASTKQTILVQSRIEFTELLKDLDGKEELQEIAEYLLVNGFDRLASDNPINMTDVIWSLNQTFQELVHSFKEEVHFSVDEVEDTRFGENVSEQVGQMIRFINFIRILESIDKDNPSRKELMLNLKDIKNWIFSNRKDYPPRDGIWALSFKNLEKLGRQEKKGFEAYYTGGLVEIVRTIANKKRHKNAFPKNFKTDFNFYDDFPQILGIYNLSLYAFIEMVEAWVSIKPFLMEYDEKV